MKIYKVSFVFCFISVLCLFSCGLANYNSANPKTVSFQDSRNEEDESTGVFNSPAGRLESEDICSDNDDCVKLCDSMLKRFSDQKKCYDQKEKEVQVFRDVYNQLAIGNPRKLERVDTEQMEEFLIFGPELWKDAITGFEKGRKENCTTNLDPEDPRDREDCKFDTYYKQDGYWSSGAAAALEWIGRNDWLSELIEKNDEDHVIMKALLDVLAHGGKDHSDDGVDDGEPEDHRANVCALATNIDPSSATTSFSVKLENHYKALGSDCLGGQNYLHLAVQRENKNSVNLGHQVLDDLCGRRESCIKYFYCNITGGTDPTDKNSAPPSGTVLWYILHEAGISGFNNPDYYSDEVSWCSGF